MNVKAALRGKVAFIRDGVFVFLSTSHAFVDATSLSAVFGALAAVVLGEPGARLSHGSTPSAEPGLQDERGALQGRKNPGANEFVIDVYEDFKMQAMLWWMLGLDYRPL